MPVLSFDPSHLPSLTSCFLSLKMRVEWVIFRDLVHTISEDFEADAEHLVPHDLNFGFHPPKHLHESNHVGSLPDL